ncbi:NADH dehydrogenase [ubiquinone] 1 beta subcomplex subunit 5, mitochondrial-like [Hemicordylus capensis]|uniref:NADH dehydrogenase [ubiquinone] 1 beta subcomplex subunit 5, mitochondrial-like n=1 Tax=Hemicordylus capensis TaxID=884348 RepID=UPI002302486A|nr:NADH dehydrogenase [ubiquinone] 1 beta subcomplex subunit 5, mitochondrial-like [Hemicordylus capensis]
MAAMSLLLWAAAALASRRTSSAVWGRLPLLGQVASHSGVVAPVRHGRHGKRMFTIKPINFYDRRYMYLLRFYILLTGISLIVLITFVNVFIGEAELAEIPEGYVPEHWEYYSHPITRWITRNCLDSLEKEYEKGMTFISWEAERAELRRTEKEVSRLMQERGDGAWYQYETPSTSLLDYSPKATPDN